MELNIFNLQMSLKTPNELLPIEDTATLTASIDKWQLGDQTSSTWLDGPSMKLHRKDIADNEVIDLTAKDGHQAINISQTWIKVIMN